MADVKQFSRVVTALMFVFIIGCGDRPERIETKYGRRRGVPGARSVNGTSVLADMFEKAGYQVSSGRRLSPSLESADVIVWAPDDFKPPTDEQREFLEQWLTTASDRTLVYIGRDFEAAIVYWKKILDATDEKDKPSIQERLNSAQQWHDKDRDDIPAEAYSRWFTVRRDKPHRNIATLSGPWSRDIDATKVEIELEGRLDVPRRADLPADDEDGLPNVEALLRSEGDMLASRVTGFDWDGSQIVVVVNGSFLLNLPLINHEHRKLAGRLIMEADGPLKGKADPQAVFLETGPGGPDVTDDDSPVNYRTGMEALTTWPLGVILLHLLGLGILYCFARFPVFGRPRELEREATSDFSKHIAAFGGLLRRTGEREYAKSKVKQYHDSVNKQSSRPAGNEGASSKRE